MVKLLGLEAVQGVVGWRGRGGCYGLIEKNIKKKETPQNANVLRIWLGGVEELDMGKWLCVDGQNQNANVLGTPIWWTKEPAAASIAKTRTQTY